MDGYDRWQAIWWNISDRLNDENILTDDIEFLKLGKWWKYIDWWYRFFETGDIDLPEKCREYRQIIRLEKSDRNYW